MRIYKASVTVSDRTPPLVAITGGGLASGRWVSGEQVVQYAALDNVGVRSGRVVAGSTRPRRISRGRVTTRGLCRARTEPAAISVETNSLGEGTQPIAVEAIDAAGNAGLSKPVTARIDNTPPARVDVAVDGGEGWRRTPDFVVRWTNPSEGDRAPIAAAHHQPVRARRTGGARQAEPRAPASTSCG